MANFQTRLSVSMYDNIGGKGTFLAHANVPEATTLTVAKAALATLVTNLATISTGGVTEATFSLVDRDVAAAPATDADIVAGANFGYLKAGSPARFGQFIPSFLDSLILPGGKIDITATVQAAWVAYMLSNFVSGGNFANNDYENYAAGKDAFRSSRKLRHRVR